MKKVLLSSLFLLFSCNNQINNTLIEEPLNISPYSKLISNSYENTFREYDTNNSGFIEVFELKGAEESFKNLDKNSDNKLSREETFPNNTQINNESFKIESFYNQLYDNLKKENKDITQFSTNNGEIYEIFNKPLNEISKEEFKNNLNNYFTDISSTNNSISSYGIIDWIKDKFSKNKDINPNYKPVILVQGYAEPSWYFMYGIYRNLKKTGRQVYTINLFPNIGDITEAAKLVQNKIDSIKKEKSIKNIDYVAHSMGGLIGRYYIDNLDKENSIEHYISVATPHYGTKVARFGIGKGAKQMIPNSEFLNKLNSKPLKSNIKYTSIWTKTDQIVIPAESAKLQGSNIMEPIKFTEHLLILFAPQTYKQIQEALSK